MILIEYNSLLDDKIRYEQKIRILEEQREQDRGELQKLYEKVELIEKQLIEQLKQTSTHDGTIIEVPSAAKLRAVDGRVDA